MPEQRPAAENAYGFEKRLRFIADAIASSGAQMVLDVGCGTGNDVAVPLAERFPSVTFLATDADPETIAYARAENTRDNLTFGLPGDEGDSQFDLIIASEVLEHVEEPIEFLSALRGKLRPGGSIVLTVPNGYGPFEIASAVEAELHLLAARRRRHRAAGVVAPSQRNTLAVSPHINFFSRRQLLDVVAAAGLEPRRFEPRTVLCGWGLDRVLRGRRVLDANARLADKLPVALSSDWMLVLVPVGTTAAVTYRRTRYGELRRRRNERRWSE